MTSNLAWSVEDLLHALDQPGQLSFSVDLMSVGCVSGWSIRLLPFPDGPRRFHVVDPNDPPSIPAPRRVFTHPGLVGYLRGHWVDDARAWAEEQRRTEKEEDDDA